MKHLSKDMIVFLLCAKKKTYAGKGYETTPSRPNSHDLIYTEGEFTYIDTYLGGKRFSGEEALWMQANPIWSMNYSGRVLSERFSGDFLKEALLHVPEEYPYRGPLLFQSDEYTYHCIINGDTGWFQGYEEIFAQGEKVYECFFHGGCIE